jgi:hypothetical protein
LKEIKMKINKKQAGILLGAITMMEFDTTISLYTMELKLELLKFHDGEDAPIRIWETLCQIEAEKGNLVTA